MGYLFLSVSLLAGTCKGYCGKMVSNIVKSLKGTVFSNLLRMLLCIFIGFVVVLANNDSVIFSNLNILPISALSGISTACFVILWITCLRSGAYVMLDVFIMLGVGVTIALCKIFFNEEIEITQIAGFILLLISAFIMCSYSNRLKGKLSLKSLILLSAIGLSNGLTDFSQKLFIYTASHESAAVFNLYTYIFAFIVFLVFYLFLNRKSPKTNDAKNKKVYGYVSVMSICLFANSYFKTLAAGYIDSATLYPLSTGIALLLSLLMASFVFKEKATPKCIFGAALAFVSLLIINL